MELWIHVLSKQKMLNWGSLYAITSHTLHRVKKYKSAISKYNLIFTQDQVFPLEVLLKAQNMFVET